MNIYQIYFKEEQLNILDPCCIPYDNSKDISREYEYKVMLDCYNKITDFNYLGVLSWCFGSKTGRSVSQFKNLIESSPGFDCYAMNPYPFFIENFGNVWKQGECHKGITNIAQDIFNEAGYEINLAGQVHSVNRSTYCNYWIGNKMFWDSYINFTLPIYNTLKNSIKYKEILFDEYGKGYFPYIMERLFTTFTHYNKEMKVKVF